MSAAEFQKIGDLARARFGLNLPEGKEGLVAARLAKAMRQGGFASFNEYYRHVIADRTGEALTGLIDSLTTNHTGFFREPRHFDFLTGAVAEKQFGHTRTLRIWSAACSSGEEPYSIAMSLLDASKRNFWIAASDISTRVIQIARGAVYDEPHLHSMPEPWRQKYIVADKARAGCYRIKPEVARFIQFERLNLIERLPPRHFHFIFCRNVLMYFEKSMQQKIVCGMAACLEPDGYFFTGHSETLNAFEHPLRYVRPAIYQLAARSEA
ncbi:MAG: CheR family methyltransferase [Bryobacteraceae bacterium]